MSVEAITWALAQDNRCKSGAEMAVLFVLANYTNSDGTCYPGQETIARKACVSVKTVERSLQEFEARGWVVREERRRKDGSRTSDLIHLIAAPAPERRDQQDTQSGSAPATRHPVQTNQTPCPNLPDTESGLTTFEPLGETKGDSKAHSAAAAPTSANESKAPPTKAKRTSIPDGFPGAADIEPLLVAHADEDLRVQSELFRNHALQEGRMVVDWPAAWRSWVIKAKLPLVDNRGKQRAEAISAIAREVAVEAGPQFAEKWLYGAEIDEGARSIVAASRIAADTLRGVQALAGWTISKAGAP